MSNVDDVLEFWIADSEQGGEALTRQRKRWYRSDAKFDAEIRNRFEAVLQAAARGELAHWESTPDGRLALIILFDQFPRNIYRGQAAAFAYDHYAAHQCLALLAAADDRHLGFVQRSFAYMPLQHSEELALQERSVELFTALAETASREWQSFLENSLGYALEHRDIVARFGRFPHRNEILGRSSRPAELAYLRGGGTTFGQDAGV
ncbi:MAG: DUF924 domain-containing protein [Gammaproteobacteria bacterium]|nr:DUF924 domain-containing protein [Gammaproteobacteria bacterium]MDH3465038.1 DUF924 domain-containing protein [Gammaproteobacteria bacterium]